MDNTFEWAPTGLAVRLLGCSEKSLKRYADRDEFLIEGIHFRFGAHKNSPRVWNVQACREAMLYRGRLRRAQSL